MYEKRAAADSAFIRPGRLLCPYDYVRPFLGILFTRYAYLEERILHLLTSC